MGKNCIFMQNENFLLKIGGLVLMITAGIHHHVDVMDENVNVSLDAKDVNPAHKIIATDHS